MDFMSDSLENDHKFRAFNVINDYNREGLCVVDVDFSLPSVRGMRRLERWAQDKGIRLLHTEPGHLTQNAYIERLHRTLRQDGVPGMAVEL